MVRIIPAMGEPPASRAAVEHVLAAPRLMHLGVTEPDGTPLVHPVWYTWADEHFLLHLGGPLGCRYYAEALSLDIRPSQLGIEVDLDAILG